MGSYLLFLCVLKLKTGELTSKTRILSVRIPSPSLPYELNSINFSVSKTTLADQYDTRVLNYI